MVLAVRCRPGTVARTVFGTVSGLRRISRCVVLRGARDANPRSPDGAKRNPGFLPDSETAPHYAVALCRQEAIYLAGGPEPRPSSSIFGKSGKGDGFEAVSRSGFLSGIRFSWIMWNFWSKSAAFSDNAMTVMVDVI
jgi:hypothetical protein